MVTVRLVPHPRHSPSKFGMKLQAERLGILGVVIVEIILVGRNRWTAKVFTSCTEATAVADAVAEDRACCIGKHKQPDWGGGHQKLLRSLRRSAAAFGVTLGLAERFASPAAVIAATLFPRIAFTASRISSRVMVPSMDF